MKMAGKWLRLFEMGKRLEAVECGAGGKMSYNVKQGVESHTNYGKTNRAVVEQAWTLQEKAGPADGIKESGGIPSNTADILKQRKREE